MTCRLCNEGQEESQKHLEECVGTERRGLKDMSTEKDKITFWRPFTAKIDERDKIERETAKQAAKLRQHKIKGEIQDDPPYCVLSM